MAVDMLGDIDLTVSDIRPAILHNLKKRFTEAGIHRYTSFVADLSKSGSLPAPTDFDVIIADVPCTGSGTWGRTPEQLYYFNEEEIKRYSDLQKRIVVNAIPYLKTGGFILYITCSVFKQENEGTVDHLLTNFALHLKEMSIIKGYDRKADTMFAALLQKS
jgi:16S rRNA (cytosine967-C5)-methyltransferase